MFDVSAAMKLCSTPVPSRLARPICDVCALIGPVVCGPVDVAGIHRHAVRGCGSRDGFGSGFVPSRLARPIDRVSAQ